MLSPSVPVLCRFEDFPSSPTNWLKVRRPARAGRGWESSLAGCWDRSKWSCPKVSFICLLLLGLLTLSILGDERDLCVLSPQLRRRARARPVCVLACSDSCCQGTSEVLGPKGESDTVVAGCIQKGEIGHEGTWRDSRDLPNYDFDFFTAMLTL